MPITINLDAAPPVAIMMVGLQGAGKTTTTAKIAKRLSERMKRKVLMASLDVKRPAAQEQLAVLGRQVEIDTLPVIAGQTPVQIAKRAEQAARLQGYDVVMLDTAGPHPYRRSADGRRWSRSRRRRIRMRSCSSPTVSPARTRSISRKALMIVSA